MPEIRIVTTTQGNHKIRFGAGDATSIGTIRVPTPIGTIEFQVLPTNTPFLPCLKDLDRLGATFDNVNDMLCQNNRKFPIVPKYGHPWLLLDKSKSVAWCNLTEPELRQLHRRFGHPSVRKLSDLLNRIDEDFDPKVIAEINRLCHQCQLHQRGPQRFKFNLRDDHIEFNAEIIVDIFYLNGRPVLHVIDSATSFQAARFLPSMKSKSVWEGLRACWIDVYQGPPERIVHDAGKNFTSDEFKQNARALRLKLRKYLW